MKSKYTTFLLLSLRYTKIVFVMYTTPDEAAWPLSAALEATQGQMDGFSNQLPYKSHLEDVASVGD
jgi:hypothetical protein